MKKILIGCEYSDTVTTHMRKQGINAYSCDILESQNKSKYHIQADIREVLENDTWHALIVFPPCTHLAVSGARHFHKKKEEQKQALDFVRYLLNQDIKYICLENPVGVISTNIRKPTQIIQPYEFGDAASKKTCLWLKNFPKLQPTKNVYSEVEWEYYASGKRMCKWYSKKKKQRSKTFDGIAKAMTEQWRELLI